MLYVVRTGQAKSWPPKNGILELNMQLKQFIPVWGDSAVSDLICQLVDSIYFNILVEFE